MFDPEIRVAHHFRSSMHDTLRRSRAYGRGSARLYHKWPSMPPTVFPGPLVVLTMLMLAIRRPRLAVTALAMPHLFHPQGLRHAIESRSAAGLPDAYVQMAQEAFENIGFIEGLWRFRHLVPEAGSEAVQAIESPQGTDLVP